MRQTQLLSTLQSTRSPAWVRIAAAGWLALALALAQQHAVLHWLSHALAQASVADKAAAAGNAHCGDCDAVASFGAAAPAATDVPSFLGGAQVHGTVPVRTPHAVALLLAYRSRAPPAVRLT